MNYDGSINIDTRVDAKGINKGTKNIGNSLSGVLRAVKGIGAALGLAFSGAAVFGFVKKTLESFNLMSSGVGSKIKELKTAFESFKGALANSVLALFAALSPYIIAAVNWLTRMLTTLAAIITALFGVQNAMGDVTQETQDAGKAAKGALASFDQINVLGQKDDTQGLALPAIAIPPDLLASVEEFKNNMLAFLQPVIDAFGRLYDAILPLGQTVWEGLKWAWDNILVPLGTWAVTDLLPAFLDLLAGAIEVVNEALIALGPLAAEFFDNFLAPLAEWAGGKIIEFLDWLTVKLKELAAWIRENPEKFREFATILGIIALAFFALVAVIGIANFIVANFAVIIGIAELAAAAFGLIMTVIFSPITLIIAALGALVIAVIGTYGWFLFLKNELPGIWETIKNAWGEAATWFTSNVITPLMNGFDFALAWIAEKFTLVFNGIRDFVAGVINDIVALIEGMINALVGGVGILSGITSGIGGNTTTAGGGNDLSFPAPQSPRFSAGNIAPVGAEINAMNKQSNGGAGLDAQAVRQIMREENQGQSNRQITIKFDGNLAPLVRELKPYIDQENARVGGSLSSGVSIS